MAACLAAVLVGGLWALLRGQDANWDLRNYHLYNGYAALGSRWLLDLAPAQLQSYFHPLLDVFAYRAMVGWPAPWVGFALGALHGLVFALVASIAWRVLEDDPRRAVRVPLLAAAALASGAFVSELGNTMADNTTALPMLGAVAWVLRAQATQRVGRGLALPAWSCAGLLIGVAVALKLTNAPYAVALGVAACVDGGGLRRRLAGTAWMTVVAMLVFAAVGGVWFWKVWQTFGNPLFPQFNGWFHAPLAAVDGAMRDARYVPKQLVEWLAWPLVFTLKPLRVSEIVLAQLVWAVLYLVLLAGVIWRWLLRRAPADARPAAPAARVLAVFFLVAFVAWQAMFSIHRYLVVLEVLAPLLLWWLWPRLLPVASLRWRVPVLVLCVLYTVLGVRDWGHEPWRARAFTVPTPPMSAPADSAVVLVGGEPQGWRVPFLPDEAIYLSVGSNFPASAQFDQRVTQMLHGRAYRYAMLDATVDRGADRMLRINAWGHRFGWDAQPDCAALRRAVKWGLRAVLNDSVPGRCTLGQLPRKMIDLAAGDARLRELANARLQPVGWRLEEDSCTRQPAWIGGTLYPYQWCRLVPAG
jgi:hypothetical protein